MKRLLMNLFWVLLSFNTLIIKTLKMIFVVPLISLEEKLPYNEKTYKWVGKFVHFVDVIYLHFPK